MQGRYIYEYSVIRLVPRVEREEFVNIGIILYCKSQKYLNIQFHINKSRIEALYSSVDLNFVQDHIIEITNIVKGKCNNHFIKSIDEGSKFRWLSAKKSTMIQYAPIHIGMTHDLDKCLEELMQLFVL
ncbi:MAG TPA: DUF3037 domain-containing protein [Saprospiraceae bacterium]|nr:DUF3037 domain-containing protein [Saprospiraceae bacterium]